MVHDNDTPQSDVDSDGGDPDDLTGLTGLEIDPDELPEGEEVDPDALDIADDDADDTDVVAVDAPTTTDPSEDVVKTDDERLHLDDDDDETAEKKRPPREEVDENEMSGSDDETAPVDIEDATDGTPLLQPRRPDEEHCQQCFLLVRKSAPKCPVDHDLCPLFPTV